MAGKGDRLLRIGAEGFDLLDNIYPIRYPPPPGRQPQRSFPQRFVMECSEAAQKYGGIVFVDPREREPVKLPGEGYGYYDVD